MATNHIVLLGAGFSRNRGAPLTNEVANSLVGKVGDDPYLQKLLTRPQKHFEDALWQIQQEYISSPGSAGVKERLDKLQAAIVAMFDQLNAALALQHFGFSQEQCFSVVELLARFDAIFGLNQDLLLESQYEGSVLLANSRRWDGSHKPGMKLDLRGHKQRWTPAPPFTVHPRQQPYFKMHGSSNWYTSDGGNLLVMGGNKNFTIGQSDVLRWYSDQFKSYLSRPDTRLMVIGYSFSDRHINEAIIEAWRNGSLKGMFLVDPAGRVPLSRHNDLEDIRSLGGSTRPISATFAGDKFEHQKFIDFFQ